MSAIRAVIDRFRARPGAAALEELGQALADLCKPPGALPGTPVALEAEVEDREPVEPGTWQEVVAARDYGLLTPPEFDYLSAVMDARGDA